jgi:hypothetical protein
MSPISKWSQPERSHSGPTSKNPQPGETAANAGWKKKELEKNATKIIIEERYSIFLKPDFKDFVFLCPIKRSNSMYR